MKLKTLLLLTALLFVHFLIYAEGDGFGENPGGAGGDTVYVDNTADLKHYAGLNEPLVIFVEGTIDVGSDLRMASFKTLAGVDSRATILGNINIKSGTNNVVIKNLNISNPANDGITIRNAKYVYVSNCTVYDCGDGCIDITVESDFVTVSYCRFYYENVEVHKFVNLIGASDDNLTDRGKLHVTMHHNWWDTGCSSRMPRVRFGRVHVYNNYFSCSGNNYASRAAIEAEILSEYNYFDAVRDPLTTDQDGKARSTGNEYVNCEGTINEGTDEVFVPSYSYTPQTAAQSKDKVRKFAGNKKMDTGTATKKHTIIHWENPSDIVFGTPLSATQLNATAAGTTSAPVYSHNLGSILPGGFQTLTVTFPEDENYLQASKTVVIGVYYEYFELNVQTTGTTDLSLVKLIPEGELINGKRMFIKDTEVKIIASSNMVSNFESWGNGSMVDSLVVQLTEDKDITAHFKTLNYIVAWDFLSEGNRDRPADFYSSDDNSQALLQLAKEDGTSTSFAHYTGESALLGKNAAMIRRGASSAGDYFFQIQFNARYFEHLKVKANMLGMNTYYNIQRVEFSIDGTNFEKAGEFVLAKDSTWVEQTVQLPEKVNGSELVVVRFKADKSSTLITNGTIGTSISEVVVLGDERSNQATQVKNKAKVLSRNYYTLDGKQIKFPGAGINIVVTEYSNGTKTSEKIFFDGTFLNH